MKRAAILWVAIALMIAGCGGGGLVGPEVLTATRGEVGAVMVSKGPVIDGTLNCKAWQLCPPLKLGKVSSDEIGQLKTIGRVLFDSTHMYVGFECIETNTGAIVADNSARDSDVWQDDAVEVFVSPDVRKGYFQFAVNSRGALMDGKAGAWERPDTAWNSKAIVKASVVKGKCWIVTMAIPLADLGAKAGANQNWALNLNRSKPLGDGNFIESSWSNKGASDYHDSTGWGKVKGLKVP